MDRRRGLRVLMILFAAIIAEMVEAKSKVHIVYMGERPQHHDPEIVSRSHHRLLADLLGSDDRARESLIYSYRHGFSGFAAKLTESQAQAVSEMAGVNFVIPNSIYKLQTTRSWDFLQLSSDSPSNLLQTGNFAKDVIIGVLDTGIWPESRSFSDNEQGPIPSRWKGGCDSGDQFDPNTDCNRKIIGARWYVDGLTAENGQPLNTSEIVEFFSPRDANGHGTHVASTAAGSFVTNVSYRGLAAGTARGGAPLARLAIYKVCWNFKGGQCGSADILKGIDEAIHDGVDVLSLSLGQPVPLLSEVDHRNTIAIGSFHAVAKGITVVCAGGNYGPSTLSISNTSPWVITVAASTVDRAFPTSITLGNNETLTGQALFAGTEVDFAGLFFPEGDDFNPNANSVCESLSLDESMVAGKVVLCFTTSSRSSAVISAQAAVKAAGGVGVIAAKNPANIVTACDHSSFPCIQVDYEIGTRLLFYFRSTSSPKVKLSTSRTVVGKPVSASVSYFSSRGPNSVAPEILKPDIAAPGANILAASSPLKWGSVGGYSIIYGTSMATPHVSAIVALLKSVHPGWSPAAIKSALVTTAWNQDPYGVPLFADGATRKPADAFDYGGGIANANGAARPGLVYDMDTDDYLSYLCSMGYNSNGISRLARNLTTCPSEKSSLVNLNFPSITIPRLRNCTTVRRTVRNVEKSGSIYRARVEAPRGTRLEVRPQVLAFTPGVEKLSFEVVICTSEGVEGGYSFGSLTWSDGVHVVRIPVSIRIEIPPTAYA